MYQRSEVEMTMSSTASGNPSTQKHTGAVTQQRKRHRKHGPDRCIAPSVPSFAAAPATLGS